VGSGRREMGKGWSVEEPTCLGVWPSHRLSSEKQDLESFEFSYNIVISCVFRVYPRGAVLFGGVKSKCVCVCEKKIRKRELSLEAVNFDLV